METNIDRISELPDALILHIFSFLNMEDVKETCMLSKRWRYLWLSSPTLRIYDTYMSNDDDDFVSLNKFINFVDRILLLRDTSSDIQTLKLRWMNINVYLDRLKLMYDVSSRIATWIMAAVKHNVQELVVSLLTYQVIKLPDCFFTCKSLTKFKFTGFGRDVTDFVLPNNTMCFPHLRYLALTGVSVVGDENLTSKLLSSCPVCMVVSGSLDLLDDLSIQFCNLRSLMVETWVSRNCMNAIAYLVKISPNIESISVGIVK
ncbi:hypothetical protein MKW94_026745, partial [Papaver nudicaule]|nr:hypothetical protein [Papaver nudicaule]